MRKLSILLGAAVATGLMTASAGTTKTYDFSGFDELDIAAGIEVIFETAPTHSVVAEFERGGPEDVKIRQSGDRLYISRKGSTGWGNKVDVTVRVTAPSLDAIEASSGSSLDASGVSAGDFVLNVSSGASVDLTGTCTKLDIEANSGGDADARGLTCSNVKASASSGGSVRAHANTKARSHTSSGGSVVVYGNPADRKANKPISGGSTRFK